MNGDSRVYYTECASTRKDEPCTTVSLERTLCDSATMVQECDGEEQDDLYYLATTPN